MIVTGIIIAAWCSVSIAYGLAMIFKPMPARSDGYFNKKFPEVRRA